MNKISKKDIIESAKELHENFKENTLKGYAVIAAGEENTGGIIHTNGEGALLLMTYMIDTIYTGLDKNKELTENLVNDAFEAVINRYENEDVKENIEELSKRIEEKLEKLKDLLNK